MDKKGTGQWGPWNVQILDPRADFMEGAAAREFSQYGEEGLLEALFARIGETNRFCFEVGAGDGVALSNTKRFRDQGWSALLIEADAAKCEQLCRQRSPVVFAVHHRIVKDDLDQLLHSFGAPLDLDFGSLDIDGQDFWAWSRMVKYRPRVMLVEYNPVGDSPPPVEGKTRFKKKEPQQAGFTAIVELGKTKDYVPLVRTAVNVAFCRKDVWDGSGDK